MAAAAFCSILARLTAARYAHRVTRRLAKTPRTRIRTAMQTVLTVRR